MNSSLKMFSGIPIVAGVPAEAQQVKDPAVPAVAWVAMWEGFDSWLQNLHMLQTQTKK